MRKLFGLLACLSFSVALVGCQNATDKKIDKAAGEMKAGINDEAKAQTEAVDEAAKETKDEIKADAKAAKKVVDDAEKNAKEEAAEDEAGSN